MGPDLRVAWRAVPRWPGPPGPYISRIPSLPAHVSLVRWRPTKGRREGTEPVMMARLISMQDQSAMLTPVTAGGGGVGR